MAVAPPQAAAQAHFVAAGTDRDTDTADLAAADNLAEAEDTDRDKDTDTADLAAADNPAEAEDTGKDKQVAAQHSVQAQVA